MSDQKAAAILNALSKQHSDELSKYTYFILAVAGAAIAYALKTIEDSPPSPPLFLAAFSVLLWGISFGFGIRNLHSFRQHMAANASCITEDIAKEETLKILTPWEQRALFASSCQFGFLVGGALTYMAYHVAVILAKLGVCVA